VNYEVNENMLATCLERLESYDIFPAVAPRSSAYSAAEPPPKAAIVGEGILSFTGNLSAQNQEDVQHAFLFATLVANKQFPLESQGREWYYKFVEVMTHAGWVPTQRFYDDLSVGGNTVRLDQLVLEILGSIVAGVALGGATSALLLKVAGSAISALQKKEKALTLFEKNLLEHGAGGMAAGTCTEIDGEVTLLVGTVRFIRRSSSTQVLFVDWDSREVKLYKGESVFRKVSSIVEQTRGTIIAKLGSHAVSKIEEYEI
jgi:hypothetical protein